MDRGSSDPYSIMDNILLILVLQILIGYLNRADFVFGTLLKQMAFLKEFYGEQE